MTDQDMDIQELDMEEHLGLRPKSWTAGKTSTALLIGMALTAIFYGIMILLRMRWGGTAAIEMFFHGGAAQRSVIPYVTVFLSFWVLGILILKVHKLAVQEKALDALPPPGEMTEETLRKRFAVPADFLGSALWQYRLLLEDADLPPIGRLQKFEYAFQDAEHASENTYTVLRGMLWAIPVLGFIGTVLGLAQAVGSFGALTGAGSSPESFEAALATVTGGLATAFETTLIALAAALILQLLSTFVMHREEKLFERVKARLDAEF